MRVDHRHIDGTAAPARRLCTFGTSFALDGWGAAVARVPRSAASLQMGHRRPHGLGRALAEYMPVGAGKATEFEEPAVGRGARHGAARVVRVEQRLMHAFEAVANQELLRAEAIDVVERVAQRA